nr:PQQ-binding-like beta-propeller repeat protein [Motilibacter aurantiacus]
MAGGPPAQATPGTAVVTGTVYDDANGNGTQDADEGGIKGVAVSDGRQTVTTDRRGRYTITVDTERRLTDYVQVSLPSGWALPLDESNEPEFYQPVEPDAAGYAENDFALRRDPRSRDEDFRFVGLADVHVQAGTLNDRERFTDQLDQVDALVQNSAESGKAKQEAPRFVVVSGDLTNNATPGEFADYRAATATSSLPVWPAVGNHEYDSTRGPSYAQLIENYRQAVGPEWYSFTYGDKHFLVLDDVQGTAQADQLAWARQDLALHGPGNKVVVITHIPLNTPQTTNASTVAQYVQLFEQYDTELLLAGHTHTNDVDDEVIEGALHAVTTSSAYTIDQTPNGFRVVRFLDGEVSLPFREYDADPTLSLVRPGDGGRLPQARTEILLDAYETSKEYTEARFRIDGGAWHDLEKSGEWSWAAAFDASQLSLGAHRIEVLVVDKGWGRHEGSGTFTVVPPAQVQQPRQGAPWSGFHGDPAHRGVAGDTLEPPLGLAWAARTGGHILTSSPAVTGGGVFVGVRDDDGVAQNSLLGLELATGQQRWRVHTDGQIETSPATDGATVFAVSVRGTLYAVDAASGATRWTWRPPGSTRTWGYFSPTVTDGTVYMAYTLPGSGVRVTALDATTGAPRWTSGNSGATWHAFGSPAVADGTVYIVAQGGQVTALNAETGAQRWTRTPAGGWSRSAPVVADGLVLTNHQSDILVASNAETGVEAWRYSSPGRSYLAGEGTGSAPAVADGTAYVGFSDGSFTAVDLATGRPKWSQTTGHAILSSPAVSGDMVYVGSNDGYVRGFDRETGQPLWSYRIGPWVASSPAVSGNALVIGAWDGNVYAFTPTGEPAPPRWSRVVGTVTAGGPALPAARVVARDDDGEVVGDVSADGQGRFSIALPPGTYTLDAARRGFGPARRVVAVSGHGATVPADLALPRWPGPVAGTSDVPLDWASSTRPDTVLGTPYAYVGSDRITGAVTSEVAANNLAGAAQPGWLTDLGPNDALGQETLDWSELLVTAKAPGGPDWNRPGEQLPLPEVTVDGAAVVARGVAQADADVRAALRYEAVPGLDAVKMTLELTNAGTDAFSGNFAYVIDPDSTQDVSIVPGRTGQNPGYVAPGTAKFLYDGAATAGGSQAAHVLTWPEGQAPKTLEAMGYVAGLWFDASLAGGASRTITWYHGLAYPSAGPDVTINAAALANALTAPPGQQWSRVEGRSTDAQTGNPIPASVLVRDTSGAVRGGAVADAQGRYSLLLPPGEYTLDVSRRGYATGQGTFTLSGTGGGTVADIALARRTGPVAGTSDVPLDWASSTRPDTVAGQRHHYVESDRLTGAITSRVGANNSPGAAQPGWLSDLGPNDAKGAETLDWSELLLTRSTPGTPDWNRPGEHLPLPDVTVEGNSVVARGASAQTPAVKAKLTYAAEPGLDAVRMTLELTNTGSTAYTGNFAYVIDPDSAQDVSIVPGRAGTNAGYVAPGSATYLYTGATGGGGEQAAHVLAWPAAQAPRTLEAAGYVAGLWFDASLEAGASRTITWWHGLAYPSAGPDVTAGAATLASALRGRTP